MAQVSLGPAAYRDIVCFPARELLDCRRNLSVRNKIKSGTGCVLPNARQSAEAASSLTAHAIASARTARRDVGGFGPLWFRLRSLYTRLVGERPRGQHSMCGDAR